MNIQEYLKIAKFGDIIDTSCPWGHLRMVLEIKEDYFREVWVAEINGEYVAKGVIENTFGSCVWECKVITNIYKSNTMNTIKNTIKSLLRTEPEKSFIKVGFLDESENITQKGREALEYVLWENNKNELKKLAEKLLDDGKDTPLA